jgi:DNA-binding transcriptional MerR regulator
MTGSALTIAEMARRSGLSAHTLRYYERIGLIPPLARNRSGHRLYGPADLTWIDFLDRLRRTGMAIRDMKRYATLRARGNSTLAARRELLEAHRRTVAAEIAALTANLKTIEDKIRTYRRMERDARQTETIHGK